MIERNTVHQSDAIELMSQLDDVSVNAYITDVPYGTTACSWDTIIPFEPMWREVKRTLKPRGVFVTTASQPFTSKLIMSNLEWFKYCWTWIKSKPSDHINAKNKPMKKHEDVAVFSPGTTANCSPDQMNYYPQGLEPYGLVKYRPGGTINTKVIGYRPSHVNEYVQELTGYPDSVLEFANGNNDNQHPTQKPVALYEYLINTYTQPGDLVVDFCAGSGTTAVAARNLKRDYIVGDTDAGYVAITRERLRTSILEPHYVKRENDFSDLPLFAELTA